MRWVVGDIHGCAVEFERLLARIRLDPAHDELWSIGDLVNRGPDSLAVLRMWRDVGARGVLGNHDIHALRTFAGTASRPRPTLDGLLAAPDADELLGLLRALPVMVHLPATGTGPEAWLVHAGLHPAWHDLAAVAAEINEAERDDAWLTDERVQFAVSVRCTSPDGERCGFTGPPDGCPAPFVPWDSLYRAQTLVVHGHWAARGRYRGPRTLGLDSGCVYGGSLSAWCQEEDRVVEVASAQRH